MDITLILALVIALAVGLALGWLLRSREIAAQRSEVSEVQAEVKSLQSLLEERERARLQLEEDYKRLQEQWQALSNQKATLEANFRNQEQKIQDQKKEQEEFQQRFEHEFKNLAEKIFEEKTKKFAEQNKTNLGDVLNPLRERISEFQKKVEESNTAGEKRSAALGEQLKNIRELNQQITQEAKNLSQALRGDSKSQGNWGEMQLEQILQKAGLQKGTHYRKEQSYRSQEGSNQRLDFIIDLPDGKNLILDSKVSLTAYTNYFESDDEKEKERYLQQHLTSLYNHMKALSQKNYQELYGIHAPDYVMMFIANEPALTLALREDPGLYDKALEQNLVLVSTTTLLATMRTISYIWKQDAQNRNAEEIARQAGNLYDKFVNFLEDLKKLGNQMGTARKTYEEAMKKLYEGNGNLIRRTENLKKLGANSSRKMDQAALKRAGATDPDEGESD